MISRRLLLDALCEAIFVAGSLRDLTDYDKWASPDPTKPTEIFIRTQLRHVNAVDLAQEIFDVDLSIQLRFVFKSSLSTNNKLFRIPTVKLKIPGKLFLKSYPQLLLHSSYSF